MSISPIITLAQIKYSPAALLPPLSSPETLSAMCQGLIKMIKLLTILALVLTSRWGNHQWEKEGQMRRKL